MCMFQAILFLNHPGKIMSKQKELAQWLEIFIFFKLNQILIKFVKCVCHAIDKKQVQADGMDVSTSWPWAADVAKELMILYTSHSLIDYNFYNQKR